MIIVEYNQYSVICYKMLLYLSNLGFCGMLLCAERNHTICVRNVSRIWAKELWSPYYMVICKAPLTESYSEALSA